MITLEMKCQMTGKVGTMDLPLTHREYERAWEKWEAGTLIQDAFPTLTADQREFIKTGMLPETWVNLFDGGEE